MTKKTNSDANSQINSFVLLLKVIFLVQSFINVTMKKKIIPKSIIRHMSLPTLNSKSYPLLCAKESAQGELA